MEAVCYCRVSTEEESQMNALADQIIEAKNAIKNNGWILIDSYIDEGKSGTSTQKRDEYLRLYEDLLSNKFEIVVIKSQDRLMRNVKDWYLFVDRLITNNKKLYFYLENKFYSSDDALITGIKAILAEEYSRDLSKKINNAHKNRQKKGESILITSKTWGYDKINKQVVVNECEATIVRLMFALCIQGYGSRSISKELSNRNIYNRQGQDFAEGVIRRIIRNPIYKGTVIMNKRHIDFNTKKTINNSESDWIIHENLVTPIVTSEVWDEANKIMDARSYVVNTPQFKAKRLGKNIGRFDLSSKIKCGVCGSVYWRRYRHGYKDKNEIIVEWSCSEYIKRGRRTKSLRGNRGKNVKIESNDGGCDNVHIKEKNLNILLEQVAHEIYGERKYEVIKRALKTLKIVFKEKDIIKIRKEIEQEKNKIAKQKDLLLDKLLEGVIADSDYKIKVVTLEAKLASLSAQEKEVSKEENKLQDITNRLDDIRNTLISNNADMGNIPKLLKHIEKILIFMDHVEIHLDFFDILTFPISAIKEN